MRLVTPRPWMQYVLILAGVYNIVWGLIAILLPNYFFQQVHISIAYPVLIARSIGVLAILFGIAYLIASQKPFKHWLIVFMGFNIKLIASATFLYYWDLGLIPSQMFMMVLASHMVWLLPFFLILQNNFEHYQSTRELEAYDMNPRKLKTLGGIFTHKGISLQEHADQAPTMLIFLRHFGCPFCKETLRELAENRAHIEAQGTRIVLVHMVDELTAEEHTKQYELNDLHRIADPDKRIYKAFGLLRGNIFQLFGFNVVVRGIYQFILHLNPPHKFVGDPFQMPGIFVIHKGMLVQTFKHTSVADRPDYIELARVRGD
jgi:peroxiredoxin